MHQLLLFCILTTQFIYIAIIRLSPIEQEKIFIPIFVSLLAFFCAPIQGGLSDYYSRKKHILFALAINLVSSMLFVFYFSLNNLFYLIIYILMLGIAGNISPIAIAGFKDITKKFVNFRFFVCMTLFYYFIGDYASVISSKLIKPLSILIIAFALLVICILLIVFLFKDTKDKNEIEKLSIAHQIKYIFHNFLKHKFYIVGLFGYFLLELAFYQFAFRSEVFSGFISRIAPLEIIVGAILALIFFKFLKINDEKVFTYSICAIFISFLLLLFLELLKIEKAIFFIFLMIFFGFSYSLFYSSIYSFFTRKRHHHDHGKIFGLLESMDSISYLLAIILVLFFKNIIPATIWLISLIIASLSIIFLIKFLKYDKQIPYLT